MPNHSRKRKMDPEKELLCLNKKFKQLERKILRSKQRKRVIMFSSSESSSSERSRSVSREPSSPPPREHSRRRGTRSPSRSRRGRSVTSPLESAPAPRSLGRASSSPSPAASGAALHSEDDEPDDKINEVASASCTPAGPSGMQIQIPEVSEPVLDENILKILGEEPSLDRPLGKEIHKDIATRFEHIATNGLPKETLKELLENYLIPENCTKIDAPELNPEVKPAVTEAVLKRLKAMESKQKQTAAAITALGEAITYILSQTKKDNVILKLLMDAAKIICDCQYKESLTRRGFILSGVKKDMKEQMKDTKIEKFLFGKNLSETLKAAKAIQKSSADLKPAPAKKPISKYALSDNSLNWKTPPAHRRQAPAGMQRTPPAASAPRASSYRSSRAPPAATRGRQQPQQRPRR